MIEQFHGPPRPRPDGPRWSLRSRSKARRVGVVVVTTISCDAKILRCARCHAEVAVTSDVSDGTCQTCGGTMRLERSCDAGFSLRRESTILIRCVAENKSNWRCDDRDGRDFCPEHVHLANKASAARPTSRTVEGA